MFQGLANGIMEKAMQVGQAGDGPSAMIGVFKDIAQRNGWGGMWNQYGHIMESFADKAPDQVIPHLGRLVESQGLMGTITSILFPHGGGTTPQGPAGPM